MRPFFLITINTKSAFKDFLKFFFIKNKKLGKTGKPLKNISTSPEISINLWVKKYGNKIKTVWKKRKTYDC